MQVVDGPDAVDCSKCGEKKPSRMKMRPWRLPPVLPIFLHRFQQHVMSCSPRLTLRASTDADVSFRSTGLDVSAHLSLPAGSAVYDLFAVQVRRAPASMHSSPHLEWQCG